MTRIGSDGVDSLAAIIRRQVESLGRPAASVNVSTAEAPGDEARAKKRSKGQDLASVVARRVRSIDPAEPDAERKAFHVFLESVLLAEFGEHLINDPAFHQLVDGVRLQMEGNPAVAAMIKKAATALLGYRTSGLA